MKAAESFYYHHLGLANHLERLGGDKQTENNDYSEQNQSEHRLPLNRDDIMTKAPLWRERG